MRIRPMIRASALLATAVGVAPLAHASLLTNGGFESGLSGWVSGTSSGSLDPTTLPGGGFPALEGSHVLTQIGQFTTTFNRSEVFQFVTGVIPGETYEFTGNVFNWSVDSIVGTANTGRIGLDFGAGSVNEAVIADGTTATDQWIPFLLSRVAPAGASVVRVSIIFDQFGFDPGRLQVDDVALNLVTLLPGDANGDGVVDLLDFDVLAQNFGAATSAGASEGDFNGDVVVDLLDFDILAQNFGASSPASIPEPAGSLALVGLAFARRRR